jgi:hypothetical protein
VEGSRWGQPEQHGAARTPLVFLLGLLPDSKATTTLGPWGSPVLAPASFTALGVS